MGDPMKTAENHEKRPAEFFFEPKSAKNHKKKGQTSSMDVH